MLQDPQLDLAEAQFNEMNAQIRQPSSTQLEELMYEATEQALTPTQHLALRISELLVDVYNLFVEKTATSTLPDTPTSKQSFEYSVSREILTDYGLDLDIIVKFTVDLQEIAQIKSIGEVLIEEFDRHMISGIAMGQEGKSVTQYLSRQLLHILNAASKITMLSTTEIVQAAAKAHEASMIILETIGEKKNLMAGRLH